MEHFLLNLDCQNHQLEVDLKKIAFKTIPYSSWIKNNTQQKSPTQKLYRTILFPLFKKNLTENINFSGSPNLNFKLIINKYFNLQDPIDNIPLSKNETQNILFLIMTLENKTLELLQNYRNLDPVIRQLKSWLKYKTKPIKADLTILGNKKLLRYFRKFNKTTINKNTDLFEYYTPDIKVPCLH